MKILVTGGAGFIGSAVVRLAVSRGHEVVNLDALTYAACLENALPPPHFTCTCATVHAIPFNLHTSPVRALPYLFRYII